MKHTRLTAIGSAMILALSLSACASHSHDGRGASNVRPVKSVKVINILPAGHARIQFNGTSYYSFGGVYYRPYRGGFRVVAAPVGLSVQVLPKKHRVVRVNKQRYFVSGDVYYKKSGKRFLVVRKPV